MEFDGQTISQGALTPLQDCIGVVDPWLLLPHDSCAIITFSSALHIDGLGQSDKCQWQFCRRACTARNAKLVKRSK